MSMSVTFKQSGRIWESDPWQNCNKARWSMNHDDVIKWKHFLRHWPFVRGIHRPPVNSPHKGQWRGTLMFSLIYAWINGWVNNCEAGDLIRHVGHYDVILMTMCIIMILQWFVQRNVYNMNTVWLWTDAISKTLVTLSAIMNTPCIIILHSKQLHHPNVADLGWGLLSKIHVKFHVS